MRSLPKNMRSLPKNWLAKLRELGGSDEDLRRAHSLVRLIQGEPADRTSTADLRENYCFEIYDTARRLKKYRERDGADPLVHERKAGGKKQDWLVSLDFVVDGVCGRESYTVSARDRSAALSAAWSSLHWDALDLKLIGIRSKGIARTAHIRPAEATS